MFSRLQGASHLSRAYHKRLQSQGERKVLQNVISKRWSGHNNMEIKPSNADWMEVKNWVHFYTLLGAIPAAVISTIVGIRANPELSEVPDGYEPRYWEYFKHPISRWMAKYVYCSYEEDHETVMSYYEWVAENKILNNMIEKANKVMSFYNDHRSMYFLPNHADYYRIGREEGLYLIPFERTETGYRIDQAYDPDINPVPTEGFLGGAMK